MKPHTNGLNGVERQVTLTRPTLYRWERDDDNDADKGKLMIYKNTRKKFVYLYSGIVVVVNFVINQGISELLPLMKSK